MRTRPDHPVDTQENTTGPDLAERLAALLCLCCLHVLWERCFGKAADRVRLVSEDAGAHARVVVHDCVGVVGGGREDAMFRRPCSHTIRSTAGWTNASVACSSIAM